MYLGANVMLVYASYTITCECTQKMLFTHIPRMNIVNSSEDLFTSFSSHITCSSYYRKALIDAFFRTTAFWAIIVDAVMLLAHALTHKIRNVLCICL